MGEKKNNTKTVSNSSNRKARSCDTDLILTSRYFRWFTSSGNAFGKSLTVTVTLTNRPSIMRPRSAAAIKFCASTLAVDKIQTILCEE